jgi:hypothetical protein
MKSNTRGKIMDDIFEGYGIVELSGNDRGIVEVLNLGSGYWLKYKDKSGSDMVYVPETLVASRKFVPIARTGNDSLFFEMTTTFGKVGLHVGFEAGEVDLAYTAGAAGAVTVGSYLILDKFSGWGSTATKIPYFADVYDGKGSDFTYTNSAVDGLSIPITEPGEYYIGLSFNGPNGGDIMSAITLNSSDLTAAPDTLPRTERLTFSYYSGGGIFGQPISAVANLVASDIIRPQLSTGVPNVPNWCSFEIIRIGDLS